MSKYILVWLLIVVSLYADGPTYIQGQTINQSVTWTSGNSPYVIQGNVIISGSGFLTIEPGVVVKFSGHYTISGSGKLYAVGTAGNKIVFTSLKDDTYGGDTNGDGWASSPARGDWYYIQIQHSESSLQYCVVRYCGGMYNARTALLYIQGTSVVKNCLLEESYHIGIDISGVGGTYTLEGDTVRNCNHVGINVNSGNVVNVKSSRVDGCGYGIYVKLVSALSKIEDNVLSGNVYGITVEDVTGIIIANNQITTGHQNHYPFYQINASQPNYTNNTVSGIKKIAVAGSINSGTNLPYIDVTWKNVQGENYVYVVVGNVSVNALTSLTIEPGVVVKFSGHYTISGSGKLYAVGTAGNKIVFTSLKDDTYGGDTNGDGWASSPARGDWYYIQIQHSESSLQYCVVRYCGGMYNARTALLYIQGTSVVKNCLLEESYHIGIDISGVNTFTLLNYENNIIRRCNSTGLKISNSNLTQFILKNNLYEFNDIGIELNNVSPAINYEGISNNRVGVLIHNYSHPVVSNCYLDKNTTGIEFSANSIPSVNNNNILNSISNIYKVSANYSNPDAVLIEARNNYYGTTDTNLIKTKITDNSINNGLAKINWRPFLTQPIDIVNQIYCRADINLDLSVNGMDLAILGSRFGTDTTSQYYFFRADINRSGRIDGLDLAILGINFGRVGNCNTLLNKMKMDTDTIYLESDWELIAVGDTGHFNIFQTSENTYYAFYADMQVDTNIIKIVDIEEAGYFSNGIEGEITSLYGGTSSEKTIGITRLHHSTEVANLLKPIIKAKYVKSNAAAKINGHIRIPQLGFVDSTGKVYGNYHIVYRQNINDVAISITNYSLHQNYPNPFNPATSINFDLPEKSEVTISIFSSLGELVRTVVTGQYEAGRHSVQFNAIDLSSGVYFYRIAAGKYVKTMKMMLMK